MMCFEQKNGCPLEQPLLYSLILKLKLPLDVLLAILNDKSLIGI